MKNHRAGTQGPEPRIRRGRKDARILGLAFAWTIAACSSGSAPTLTVPTARAFPTGVPAVRPTFGPTVIASAPPPPISGGTLLASRDGSRAVAADPERDSVYVVDLKTHAVAVVALTPGDEPGRVVEDGAGRVHVALRKGAPGHHRPLDGLAHLAARRVPCAARTRLGFGP